MLMMRTQQLNEFYKKGCQGKKIGVDRNQDCFLRSSPLDVWIAGAVLPFSFSSVFLLRWGTQSSCRERQARVVECVSTMVLSEAHGL